MDEPRILDRYRLIERLAAGGSAEVWRAHDEQLDRPVAVKRLHPHLLPDAGSRRRLAAEARAAAGLSHPVIVGVYDVDVEGDAPALVMELVEGESMAARIARDGPLDAAEAARLVADLADALYHAHRQGVIHRDVKPGNVLLASDGRVKLVDFGIAHSLAESAERLTQTGTVIGTLRSMAPEQLAAGPISPRTDLYGLGVVLYEALTGRSPYPSTTPLVLAEAQRAGPPSLDGIDPELATIVAACLAYDPADRPLHAGALAEALRGWSAGAPTAAIVTPALAAPAPDDDGTDGATVTAPVAVVSAPVSVPEPRARGDGRLGILLPLAIASAVGLGVVWAVVTQLGADDGLAGASTTPTAAATEPPVPAWATELAAEIEAACGTTSDLGEEELTALGEEEAEDEAADLIDACEEAADEGGNRGNQGRGRGGGNNGGGNDD